MSEKQEELGCLTIRVLASVVERHGRWLVCLRPEHKRHGGLWEFPGGKLEPGETLFEAARRELAEELDVEVIRSGQVLYTCHDPGSTFFIEFVEIEVQGEPVALEHQELRWSDISELQKLNLAPADAEFVRHMSGGAAFA